MGGCRGQTEFSVPAKHLGLGLQVTRPACRVPHKMKFEGHPLPIELSKSLDEVDGTLLLSKGPSEKDSNRLAGGTLAPSNRKVTRVYP